MTSKLNYKMTRELVPEMHDIGKLVDNKELKRIISQYYGILEDQIEFFHSHALKCRNKQTGQEINYFKDIFGIDEPKTKTWEGINHHHDDKPPDPDLFLLKLADRRASAVSRTLKDKYKEKIKNIIEEEKKKRTGSKDNEKRSVYKLWNPKTEQLKLFSKEKDFESIFAFISKDPDEWKYLKNYNNNLLTRPEELEEPGNIISLYAHSELVGKLYRFFNDNVSVINPNKPEIKLADNRPVKTIGDMEGSSNVNLVKYSVNPLYDPVRVRDLNIFDMLKEISKEVFEQNNVLFRTSTEFLAILPTNEDVNEIIKPFLDMGFYVDVEEAHTILKNAYPTPGSIRSREMRKFDDEMRKFDDETNKIKNNLEKAEKGQEEINNVLRSRIEDRDKKIENFEARFKNTLEYGFDLKPKIKIPICELCQTYEGTKKWPRDYICERLCSKCQEKVKHDDWPFDIEKLHTECIDKVGKLIEESIEEDLCGICFNIRSQKPKLEKLAKWESNEEDVEKIIFMKISLEINELRETLEKLYHKYLTDLGIYNYLKNLQKSTQDPLLDIRFSLLYEFQRDYDAFLGELMSEDGEKKVYGRIVDALKNKNADFQWILPDLFCIRIEKTSDINRILDEYNKVFTDFFQKFKDVGSPIKLSISCSNVKFPFQWHWRLLSDPKEEINVHVINKGEINIKVKDLEKLMEIKQPKQTAFHKLAKISEISEKLAWIELRDKSDWKKYNQEYRDIRTAIMSSGITNSFKNIINYVKIMAD